MGSRDVWVWLDLEMTGLDPQLDQILEVSCILTQPNLIQIGAKPFSEVVHHDNAVLENMSEWCIEHHGESGLTQSVRDSQLTLSEVERQLVQYVNEYTLEEDVLYLAGNSIHTDRQFIKNDMKGFDSLLHYRMIDVTSVGLVAESIGIEPYSKDVPHRALEDIIGSINELKYYISHMRKS